MNQPLLAVPRSSLASKYLLALTGLGLIGFVIVHMLGNLQVFAGREALNSYAHKLRDLGSLLWLARLGLLTLAILHVVYAIRLWLANRTARPLPYHYRTYRKASLASRTMIWTGSAILVFIIFHLLHFTFFLIDPGFPKLIDPIDHQSQDVYGMVILGFRNRAISLGYVAVMGVLAFHISHGFQSLFQSLGLNHPRWAGLLTWSSWILALTLFVGNSSMPLAILFGFIGGD
jgi:succinate dehydrogenase / fumarate reductase cytochrome b subunit